MPKPEMSPPTISLNEKSPRIDIPSDCITLSISQNEKQVWACSLSLQMVGWAGAAEELFLLLLTTGCLCIWKFPQPPHMQGTHQGAFYLRKSSFE